MVSENLLQTKGFENSVIFVNGDSISVIIGASELKKEEVAQIQNIIAREMKASIENIHISTKRMDWLVNGMESAWDGARRCAGGNWCGNRMRRQVLSS